MTHPSDSELPTTAPAAAAQGHSPIQLRPYQQECLDRILEGFCTHDKQLVVIPTGGGKTVVFAKLAEAFAPQRTLILAHREELITQAAAKLLASTGIRAEVEKAERRASLQAPVVIASVQSLQGERLRSWPKDHFSLVVADEAHHALAAMWQNPLQHFTASVLGVTATPHRGDKKDLGSYFENIPYEIGLGDLVAQGYLAPPKVQTVPIEIDVRRVNTHGGDYDDTDLANAITPYLREIMAAVKSHASGRKLLFFLPLIATSKLAADIAAGMGISSVHVDGEDPRRQEKLAAFSRGEYQALFNAMLLLEGYDEPSIDCVVMLRPTQSQALYAQAIGRGTRLFPGKEDLLILDFLWLHEKHALCRPAHLIAKSDEEARAITDMAAASGRAIGLAEACALVRQQREDRLRHAIEVNARRAANTFDLAEIANLVGDCDLTNYEPVMKWQQKPVTEAQLKMLAGMGADVGQITSCGLASEVLDRLVRRRKAGLASIRQIRVLERLGYPRPLEATARQAHEYLERRFGAFQPRRTAAR